MKNLVKLFGIIAMVATIGFLMAACGEDPDNGDPTGNESNPFKGRWTGTATTPGGAATFTLVFDDTTFENTLIFDSFSVKQRGAYTFTGNAFSGTCTSVYYDEDDEDTGWVDSGEFFETYSGNPWSGSISGGILTASAGGVSFTSN